jgi:hypothetical protein
MNQKSRQKLARGDDLTDLRALNHLPVSPLYPSSFFAIYNGFSMHPTLREPEVMEIAPYNNRPLQVGDVIFFTPPTQSQAVVHRVIQVTPAGIRSQGDNSSQPDNYLLQPANIAGQVVAAWRGQQRRQIVGGWQGRLARRWLQWRRGLWWNLYRPAFRLAQPV